MIIFVHILVLAVLLIAGFGMNRSMNSYGDLSDMALKNVLALADGEDPDPGEDGNGGTSVGYCYVMQSFQEYKWKIFCHSGTDDNTIFPCTESTFGGFLESAKDRCTK